MRPAAAVLSAALLVLPLGACSTIDTSRMGANIARSQCLAEAHAYPRAVEDCEGIGRAAPDLP